MRPTRRSAQASSIACWPPRASGIDAAKLEIRPAARADRAWIVSEIDRRWPTQVDSVAVNPHTFQVTDKVEFAQFGLLAKLTRWGVDAHMGILFGPANQLVLAFSARRSAC